MNQVLVIGAGAAGLAAARELADCGIEPLVLEARERCGGRILSVHGPLSPVPLELGAEFVHGVHPDLWNVLRESNAIVVAQEGEHVGRGRGEDYDSEAVGRIFAAMAEAPEQSFAAFIAGLDAPEPAKRSATAFVEGFNAALKEDVSIEWLNHEQEDEGNFRVLSGYDSVPNYLARGLHIRYSTPVRRLRWRRGAVVAETPAGEIRATQAIITVPFAVLSAGGLIIDPEPETLMRARGAIGNGEAIRITLRFREAAWQKHPRLSFLHGEAPFPVWWTPYPVVAPLITAWAAGPRALALRGLTQAELIAVARRSLHELLETDPGEPLAAYFHDWHSDPWSRAAYSYVRVNGMRAQRNLAEPVEDTIYFAGEAAAEPDAVGTVHGALASGITAARKVSLALGVIPKDTEISNI